jgi:hypothetical protein
MDSCVFAITTSEALGDLSTTFAHVYGVLFCFLGVPRGLFSIGTHPATWNLYFRLFCRASSSLVDSLYHMTALLYRTLFVAYLPLLRFFSSLIQSS